MYIKIFKYPTFFSLYILIAGFVVTSQSLGAQINILRYNDNFSALKNDTLKRGLDKLKYIKLGKNASISFGGELREQYQYFENQNFGDVPPSIQEVSVGQIWHRTMGHANLEIGSKFRLFSQFNSTLRFLNPNPITPEIDENQLSLHQFFVDYSLTKAWLIRIGKQELGYGNNRLLTFREGPNTRLAFNAAMLKYYSAKRKIDLLAITPSVSKQYVFDDTSFDDYVLGIYGTENFVHRKLLFDYYFLNFSSKNRKYNFVSGNENRQSFGFRVFSQNPKLNYELEGTYQTGTFNELDIAAYGISADFNYILHSKSHLTIGVGANYISGDKSPIDNQLNTYNLIFSKPQYGLAAPIGSSNIENLNPYIKMRPTKKLSILGGVYFMRRQSIQDGTYSPGMAQVRPTPAKLFVSSKSNIGTQYALETNFNWTKNISFSIDAAYFASGNYVKETGKGLNISYVSFKSTLKI